MKTFIYVKSKLGIMDFDSILKSIDGKFDGLVCTPDQILDLGEDCQRIDIAQTNDVLRQLLQRRKNVFVPNSLSECLVNYTDLLSEYPGQVWLEDSYISRYITRKISTAFESSTPLFGLVGSLQIPPMPNRNLHYSYMANLQDVNIEQIFKVLHADLRSIWLPFISAESLIHQLSKLSRILESFELVELFSDMAGLRLDGIWGSRSCIGLKHALPAGTRLSAGDLETIHESMGLSVDLMDDIVGKTLRYNLPAKTALTFGMIEC
jgi:hypothetical protein